MTEPPVTFAGLLRQLRAAAQLTQEELADRARLSARSISDLERGITRTTHRDTAELLAAALGLAGPARDAFVAAARGRGPVEAVLAAREGRTPDAGRGAECPYRGLLPFSESDAKVFYGREQLAEKLAARVSRGGLVVVTGASGSGKSSLLRAGLVPILAQGQQIPGSDRWPRIVMTPTKDPLTELATRLAAVGGPDALAVRDGLAQHPDQAHLAIRSAVLAAAARRDQERSASTDNAPRLVLIVDQFEQVFTLNPDLSGKATRQAFIAALCSAAASPAGPEQEPPALVAIAVRGDFWDRCAAVPELIGALQDGQFVVGPMTESELRVAITGPAETAGLRIEPGLTDTILGDLRVAGGEGSAGVLPLLSQAMALTWEKRDGDRLTSHGYGLTGGVSRAVQTGADRVYEALPAGQQALARDLLREMTITGRDGQLSRRPVTRADLYAGHPDADRAAIDAVLEAFAEARLIVADSDTVQISHDVLLSAWPTLRGWLEEDQASWILHGQFADDAAAWHDHHGDPSFLYRGTQLAAVQQAGALWSASPGRYPTMTSTQSEFLRASQRAAVRGVRRRRGGVAVLVLLTVAALIASVFAFQQRSSYLTQRNQAIDNDIAAEAFQTSATDPSLAAQLTLAAYRIKPTQDLATELLGTENTPLATPLATNSSSPIQSVAVSPDGRTLASVNLNGVIQLWNIGQSAHPRLLNQFGTASSGGTSSVAFSPDGRTLAATGYPGSDGVGGIWLWDISSPAHPRPLGQPLSSNGQPLSQNDYSSADAVAFSPDGHILATAGSVSIGNSPANMTIQLWDMSIPARPRPLGHFTISFSFIESLIFSPDGRTLVLGGESTGPNGGTVQLWDVSSAEHPYLLQPQLTGTSVINTAAYSRGGILAITGNSGAIQLWDAADPTHLRPLGSPIATSSGSACSLVMFSPDGQTLACADTSGTIKLWSVINPAQPQLLSQPLNSTSDDGVDSLAFSPDGGILVSGDGNGVVQLWNVPQTVLAGNGAYPIGSVAFSPDGRLLASVNDDGPAQLWDVTNSAAPTPLGSLPAITNDQISSLAFSPDGRILAALQVNEQTGAGIVQLWSVANPAHPEPLGQPLTNTSSGGISSIAFSPEGRILAIASGLTIRLWTIGNPAHPQPGPIIASGQPDDLAISAMAFNPGGRILAAVYYSGDIELWNAIHPAAQTPLGSATAVGGELPPTLTYSPNGRVLTLVTGDRTVELWGVANPGHPDRLGELPTGATGVVDSIAFGPQGLLATDDGDGAIQLWSAADPAHPQPFGQPIAGSSSITSVAFSSDGTLASGTSTGVILLWDLHVSDAIKRICATAAGNLTSRNWHNYIPLRYQPPCGP